MSETQKAISTDLMDLEREFSQQPTETLVASLVAELEITAQRIIRIAAMVRVLESRKIDLSDIKIGMLEHIRKVARGEAIPEIIVTAQDRPLLLDKLIDLPVKVQHELAEQQTVKVAVVDGEGNVENHMRRLSDLPARLIHQVFYRGTIRSPAEQVAWIEEQEATKKEIRRRGRPAKPKVEIDAEAGGLKVGEVFISKKDLATYLAKLQ